MKKVNTGGSEEPMVAAPEFGEIKEENKDQKVQEEEQKDPSEKEPLK